MTRIRSVTLFVLALVCLFARPASAQSPPSYDLTADIAARTARSREQLGTRTDVQVVGGTFVVAAPGTRSTTRRAFDLTRSALSAYFNGRFDTRPVRAVSVYLFPSATSYEAFCQKTDGKGCMSPYGFYSYAERRIVMNAGLGLGTLTHELVHPLVEADFPNAPEWLNEGIASLFEHFYFTGSGDIHGSKNWRLPRLIQALRSKRESERASLPALFALSDAEFRGDREDLNYAAARFFCQWLDERQLLWPFYHRFRDEYASDPSGARAFRAVVGMTPAEADAEWRAWLQRL